MTDDNKLIRAWLGGWLLGLVGGYGAFTLAHLIANS